MRRSRRRVAEAVAVASVLGGVPSSVLALVHARGNVGRAFADVVASTRAIGALVPPGRPGVVRGAVAHGAVSVIMGELLARILPRRRSVVEAAAAGLFMGVLNVGLIGRRFPSIRALPLLPQLAANVAFAVVLVAVADRGDDSAKGPVVMRGGRSQVLSLRAPMPFRR
jgi:hypothetical protein